MKKVKINNDTINDITINMAKDISEKSGYDEVVIFGYNPKSGKQHITTYGVTIEQCKDAAKAGNYLKKALNWPEELCHTEPKKE